MALTSHEDAPPDEIRAPSGGVLGWFRHWHEDETASGATELLILTPVYLLFLIGLFTIGNLMIVRQALVTTTRNLAWNPDVTASENANLSGPYRGQYQCSFLKQSTGFVFNEGDGGNVPASAVQDAANAIGASRGQQIAEDAFNNVPLGEHSSECRYVRGEYNYEGINFGPALRQTTTAAVMLPRQHKRKVYKASTGGGKNHFVTEWRLNRFDPSAPNSSSGRDYRPLSPMFQGFFDRGEGIWDVRARIRGDVNSEHSFVSPGGPK